MTPKELIKVKELCFADGTHTSKQKAWTKIYISTEDGVLRHVAEIGMELYKYKYKGYSSSITPVQVFDLPPFSNNSSLFDTKEYFKEHYLQRLIGDDIMDLEIQTLMYLKNKYPNVK